jgi:hypothetical protein
MLDLNQVVGQIEKIGRDSFAEREEQDEKLVAGEQAINKIAADPETFSEKVAASTGRVLWPVARPLEPISKMCDVPLHATPVTVVGVDGSQIMPSHHEVHTCYLLNIGYVVITYGLNAKPILETNPHLFHRPDDLYPLVDRRRVHIDELYVSLERNLFELSTLAQVAIKSKERGAPVVAFIDGSLIPWSVDKLSERYQKSFLERMSAAVDLFRENRIPLIGYLSSSRATDVINMLRVALCPYDVSDCRQHCGGKNEEDFPCSTIWPLSDRQLFFDSMQKGQRSPVFLSDAEVTRRWSSRDRICFSYLHVGTEIARLEFPRWLFDDGELLGKSVAVAISQAGKGMGYPVCLSESHHLAIIRGSERQKFFELLTSHMVNLGLPKIRTSPKENRKRVGFV